MPTLQRSALVPYSAESMYALVADIETYPEFLPWCAGARVAEQTDSMQIASVDIRKTLYGSTFTTRNQLEAGKAIDMQLIEGPFRHLHGIWRFKTLNESACKVTLDIDFEFSNRLVSAAIKPAFTHVCDTVVNAFIERAHSVLGAA